MSISGKLSSMELSELLQWLSNGKKTGTLIIDDGRVEKRIYVRDGVIISSSSSDPTEYLGHFLVCHGFLTEEELAWALKWQEQASKLLGKILVDMDFIAEEDLEKMLRLKAEESIFGIFSWNDGEFSFIDGALPDYEMVPISLGVTGLLLEGMQRVDEWASIREVIPTKHCVPVVVSDPLEGAEDLEDGQAQVFAAVDDRRTVEQIGFETHASEYFVCHTLLPAVQSGAIKIVVPKTPLETPEPPGAPTDQLLRDAKKKLAYHDIGDALQDLRSAREQEPTNPRVTNTIEQLETRLIHMLEAEGLEPSVRPRTTADLHDLTEIDLSPREAFLLSRINGVYDVGGIAKISPLPLIDTLYVLWLLLRAGHIRLEPPTEREADTDTPPAPHPR